MWLLMRPRRGEWTPEPGFPPFASRTAARRAYMEVMEPDLRGKPDDFIARHYRKMKRYSKLVKEAR